jgi:hypothetical protein
MDFPIFLNKLIIGNKYLRYSSFWWWWRLISHSRFHFDDYHIWKEFWCSLNRGYHDTEYKYQFEKVWGKNSKPERIVLSQRDFDALQERLNGPPDPKVMERFREILNRPSPWSDEK